jgi:CheY-like chemotaxis protein
MRGAETESILVVEDEPMVRMLVVDFLNELGYATMEAKDAPAALPFLQGKAPIHLLLTDVGLPGMNGHQLAVEARQLRPGLKILFATGYGETGGRSASITEGTDLVGKPFDLDELGLKVRRMIDSA